MKTHLITDGGLALGMGHIQQSISFATELAARSDVSFFTKSDERVAAVIRAAGFVITRAADDDEIFGHVKHGAPDVVVFDKLDVSEKLARAIRQELGRKLVIFTNLTDANRCAHMAIVADLGSRLKNVKYTDEATGTTYYHGPKYWVLRKEFYRFKRLNKPAPTSVERAMLLFGGSDPSNLTSVVLDALLDGARPARLDVVLGAHYGHRPALDEVLARHPSWGERTTIHQNIGNVAELMFAADVVLASPGLSAFEALCVGTPVLLVPHDDLQRDAYAGLISMVERREVSRIRGMVDRMEVTFPRSASIAEMEIGEGVAELVDDTVRLTER